MGFPLETDLERLLTQKHCRWVWGQASAAKLLSYSPLNSQLPVHRLPILEHRAPFVEFDVGDRPQLDADAAALLAALISAVGRGAQTYPCPHALDWSPVAVETLQVMTSCIPFMPFCARESHCETSCKGWTFLRAGHEKLDSH